jgi:hypothetical protein
MKPIKGRVYRVNRGMYCELLNARWVGEMCGPRYMMRLRSGYGLAVEAADILEPVQDDDQD